MNPEAEFAYLRARIATEVGFAAEDAQREIEGMACAALDQIRARTVWQARSLGQKRRRWKEKRSGKP